MGIIVPVPVAAVVPVRSPGFTDLERKISVRTTREELIRRGVLKEVDENSQLPEVYTAGMPGLTNTSAANGSAADTLTQDMQHTTLGKTCKLKLGCKNRGRLFVSR